jgi:D-arabinose 1-dehydrogenase-like Zn-dependent alcohol dehydrogenase
MTMTKLCRQSLVAYGAPLCETVVDCPQPQGSEVLVRIERCGVCHSDLHVQDGFFKLAADKKLDISAGRALPFTLGHEIAGVVEAAGAQADIAPGRKVAVYPWIGCGQCPACRHGDESLCTEARHLGIAVDGGYASHVVVPHPRYLLDYEPLSPSLAGALMCSGLTAYAALKRLADRAARGPLLLVGLGGVGMMGLALARAMYETAPVVADIDAGKRDAALAAGAAAAFDPADPGARKAVLAATGGVYGVCDFVGSEASLGFAVGALAKGGKVIVTGLLGGGYSTAVAMFPLRAMTIEGTLTGTLNEAEELLALVRGGAAVPVPMTERPLAEAQAALEDLRAGRVVGRTVLTM